jgi:hypothetical protein
MFRALSRNSRIFYLSSMGALTLLLSSSCSSLPFVKQNKAYSRIFLSDFSTAWTAALDAAAAGRSDAIRSNNRETGIIDTNWVDSSEPRQFLDTFSDEDFFLRSRYRFQIQVREGRKNDEQAVMIRVLKQQQQESTFLGGWSEKESDGIEESVYLYRIGRLISMQQYTDDQDDSARNIGAEDDNTLF